MKAPFTLLLLAAIRALAQDYYSGAATFTISGTAVTFGGTDSAAFAAATATAEDISESSSSSYKGNLDSLTSAYSGSPITIEYGSSTITLGGTAPSGGFSNSANATATSSSAGGSTGGGDGGSATATPSGPTTSLSLATQPPSSGASTAQAVSGALALVGLALAFAL
ncbi:hypothetical protein F4824DRAFT_197147 [Ustulina deusta]|nr:hypothetical protein F4824DRAFT_197147 [Ustulina deusta]